MRHTLVGITLGVCSDQAHLPRVTTSLLSKPVLNFVIKIMEERCGECGTENNGPAINRFPWYVGIKEEVKYEDGGRPSKTSKKYRSDEDHKFIKLRVSNIQTFTATAFTTFCKICNICKIC